MLSRLIRSEREARKKVRQTERDAEGDGKVPTQIDRKIEMEKVRDIKAKDKVTGRALTFTSAVSLAKDCGLPWVKQITHNDWIEQKFAFKT